MARVTYVAQDNFDQECQDLVVSSLQPGKTVNVYSAVGNNPKVLKGVRSYLGALWNDSGHSDRHREIVILAVAAEVESAYEWHQHVNIATDLGLSRDEITAISEGDLESFSATEAALIEYTVAVVNRTVTDEVHEAVAERFDDEAVVGLANIVAGYLALARVIDALGVEIEDGEEFVGWTLD